MSARSRVRHVLRIGVAAAVLVLSAPLTVAGQSSAAPPTTTQPAPSGPTTAVADYGACLAGKKQGDLLLMIDQSGSLQQSDPEAARVTAAQLLVDKLTRFSAGGKVSVDVAVAGFASDFTAVRPWTRLSDSTAAELRSTIDSFRTDNGGPDTDYWTALDRARAFLADHSPAQGERCQAIAWFTDGKMDFIPRKGVSRSFAPGVAMDSREGVDKAVDEGIGLICAKGGIADQIRSSGVVMFGIGLAAGGSTTGDFDTLKSIVTGAPVSGRSCGSIVSPTPGDFYVADDIDDLLFKFDSLSTPGQAPLTTDEGVCAAKICDDVRHQFVLDDSIAEVNVLASADLPGLDPVLVGPTGSTMSLARPPASGGGTLDGARVNFTWQSDRTVQFTMAKSTGAWAGAWALAFVAPPNAPPATRSRTNIHISGGLVPTWVNKDAVSLHSGGKSTLRLGIANGAGSAVPASSVLGAVTVQAGILDPSGKAVADGTVQDKKSIGTDVGIDLADVPPGRATLRLTLALTTAPAELPDGKPVAGTTLTPQIVDIPVDVAAPEGYPRIAGRIDFGRLEGGGRVKRALTMTGSGCAWVDSAKPADFRGIPDGAGALAVTSTARSEATCVKVAQGTTASIPLELSVANAANGTVAGTVTVTLAPDGTGEPVTQVVSFGADLVKPLNQPLFIGALIATLVVGIGLPFLLLYLAKWWTARIPGDPLVAAEFPVTVVDGAVLRDGVPFALREQDLVTPVQGLGGGARSIRVGSLELRTHAGWSPFGAGYVMAEKSPLISASSDSLSYAGDPPRAKMGLAVHNSWIVAADPTGPAESALVILMVGGTTAEAQRVDLVDDMNRRMPGLVAELRQQAPAVSGAETGSGGSPFGSQSGPAAVADPFGGGSDPFGGDPFGAPASGGGYPSPGTGGAGVQFADAPPPVSGQGGGVPGSDLYAPPPATGAGAYDDPFGSFGPGDDPFASPPPPPPPPGNP